MKEKNEKIALSIFVVSLLALATVLLVTFSQGGSLTGKAVTEIDKNKITTSQETTNELSCSDSDSGKNYFEQGSVNYCDNDGNCFTKEDFCSGNKVVEWYCENNEARYEEHECDNACEDGVCVSIATKFEYTNLGGGGGGGGGTTTTTTTTAATETFNTYDLGALTSEQTLEIAKNENIKFIIASTSYTLTLTDFTQTQATITVNGGSAFTPTLGNEQNVNLNSDGVADIYVLLRSVNTITNKIKLTFGPLS